MAAYRISRASEETTLVLICTACGSCYIRGNYECHLVGVHGAKGQRKPAMAKGLARDDLAAGVRNVVLPSHEQTRIDGLRVYGDWSCNVGRCTTMNTSRDVVRQQCSRAHRLNVKVAETVSRVRLQMPFLQRPQHFITTVSEIDLRRSPELPAAAVDAAFVSLH